MGEIADMVLEGTLCCECGGIAYSGNPENASEEQMSPGHTRKCNDCGEGEEWDSDSPGIKGSNAGKKLRTSLTGRKFSKPALQNIKPIGPKEGKVTNLEVLNMQERQEVLQINIIKYK